MSSSGRFRPLLTRLLLSLAIVTCVLGLSESASAAQPPAAATAPVAMAGEAGHLGHGHVGPAALAATHAEVPSSDGHPGHGDGVHAVSCMVAVGVAAIVFWLVLAFFEVSSGVGAARRLRARVRAGLQARPPDLTTLCVQRV